MAAIQATMAAALKGASHTKRDARHLDVDSGGFVRLHPCICHDTRQVEAVVEVSRRGALTMLAWAVDALQTG